MGLPAHMGHYAGHRVRDTGDGGSVPIARPAGRLGQCPRPPELCDMREALGVKNGDPEHDAAANLKLEKKLKS